MSLREYLEQDDLQFPATLLLRHKMFSDAGVAPDGIGEIMVLKYKKDLGVILIEWQTRLNDHKRGDMEWHDLSWCSSYDVMI